MKELLTLTSHTIKIKKNLLASRLNLIFDLMNYKQKK